MLGESVGFGFGLGIRLGVQINDAMGVFVQERLIIAAGGSSGSASVAVGYYSTLLFDWTFGNIFAIGGGPSIDYGGFSRDTSSDVTSGSGTYFGLDGRIALLLGGGRNPYTGRRSGYTINADVHPTFVGGTAVTTLLFSFGWETN